MGSEQFDQLLDGQAGFMQDRSKRPQAEDVMIWHGNTREGCVPPKDNMASPLPLNYKSNSSQCFDEVSPGKVRGQFRHSVPVVTSTYSLPSSAGIGSPAAL